MKIEGTCANGHKTTLYSDVDTIKAMVASEVRMMWRCAVVGCEERPVIEPLPTESPTGSIDVSGIEERLDRIIELLLLQVNSDR